MNSLWQLNNVGKGSRQIGSVTSGKGLALRAESNGLGSDTYRLGWGLVILLPGSLRWIGLMGLLDSGQAGRGRFLLIAA